MKEHVGSLEGEVSIERIIEKVKQVRDKAISNVLKDDKLHGFLELHYDILEISAIRVEFLKRDLRELRDTSLDLVHYSSVIKQIKENILENLEQL